MMEEPNTFATITMWLSQFSTWAASITIIVAALSAVFKPVRGAVSWIFKKIYGERKNVAVEEVKNVERRLGEKIDSVSKKVDEYELGRIRYEVLSFGNECMRGQAHSKEDFDHIIQLNEDYHNLLDKRNDKNGVFDATFDFIMGQYKEHLANNDFLGQGGNSNDVE